MCLFRVYFVFSCVFIALAIDKERPQKFSPFLADTVRQKDIEQKSSCGHG